MSDYCADSLHDELKKAWESEGCTNEWNKRWQSALCRAYDSVDKACEEETGVGSTALVVLISTCQIVAANCGDSRAILCRGSQIITLSVDHKVSNLFLNCLFIFSLISSKQIILQGC